MRLGELISGVGAGGARAEGGTPASQVAGADADIEIASLAYDSRKVRPGTLFFCVPGLESDGHDFAAQAVDSGAVALLVERRLGLGVPEVLVESTRAAMGPVAARFYREPTSELRVVGITGTDGKTTTAFLVRGLLEASGEQCGLLGTVKSVIGARERAVTRTTPEAIDLQAAFRMMLDGGDRACAMEVSSHALELGRTNAIDFAAAIFTNLSRDHLDFHGTMEAYFQTKRRLFVSTDGDRRADGSGARRSEIDPARQLGRVAGARGTVSRARGDLSGVSVVNVGDAYGRRLAAQLEDVCTFAVDAPADYRATGLRCDRDGCRFVVHTPAGEREVALAMPGRFNVANALGALAAAHALGGDLDTLVVALARGVRVPGRFEPVQEGQDFAVLVDYAHTPDSLKNVLAAARELVGQGERRRSGRVLCVFGAGGDRDRGKRPLMGEVAARLADVVVVTSDNPRSEDPAQIIAEVMAGAGGASVTSTVEAVSDRGAAIAKAIADGRRGDVVVIAGKGHEQGQELAGGVKLPFDDVAVAREALRRSLAMPAGALG